MSDLSERIDEPDETPEFSLSGDDLESVDLRDTESIDQAHDEEDDDIDPVFGEDQEVLDDNLGYEQ
jgi:hypothetical protein